MGKSSLVIMALLVLTATNADAHDRQDIIPDVETERTDRKSNDAKFAEVPDLFAGSLNANISVEEFVLKFIAQLKRSGSDGLSVTREDLKSAQHEYVRNERVQRLRRLIEYDSNFDAQVTVQEIQQYFEERQKTRNAPEDIHIVLGQMRGSNPVQEILVYDLNKDGILSYQEMSSEQDPRENHQSHNPHHMIEKFLAADPNKDGQVTVEEIIAVARKSYDIVDEDKSGAISQSEQEAYKNAVRLKEIHERNPKLVPKCAMPFVSNNERLVVINSHQGSYVSTVTTTEQGDAGFTTAAKVAVKKQSKPLQLALLSDEATIYDFVEGTENVEHVYLVSHRAQTGLDVSASGVINMPKEKVTFLTGDCKENLDYHTGGKPDNASKKQRFTKVTIHADTVEYDPWTKPGADLPVKSGFEDSQWNYAAKFYADGIMEIDPAKVYSKRPAEKYEVMPNLFGVAQLLYEGKIEKTNDPRVFRIVKPIPYFPQGLQGGVSRDFVLNAGLPLPMGDTGHSCIQQYNSAGEIVVVTANTCRQTSSSANRRFR